MMNEAPGPINFTMFLTMFGEKLNGTDPEDVIRNAFACFDEEGTGELNLTVNCCLFDKSSKWYCWLSWRKTRDFSQLFEYGVLPLVQAAFWIVSCSSLLVFIPVQQSLSSPAGMIQEEYLRELLTTMGDRFTDEEVDELFREAPIDKKGNFNYVAFTRILKHGAKDKDD